MNSKRFDLNSIKPATLQINKTYEKLKQIGGYNEIKNAVFNKEIYLIYPEDITVLIYYFEAIKEENASVFTLFGKYQFDKLHDIGDVIKSQGTSELYELLTEVEKNAKAHLHGALIPVYGINVAMQSKLNSENIFDIADLIHRAATAKSRIELAGKLKCSEKQVYSWAKQADLWRASPVDEQTAYMLVKLGVRGISDLSKISVKKVYPFLKSLANMQESITPKREIDVEEMIESAKVLFAVQAGNDLITYDINDTAPTHMFTDFEYDIESQISDETNGKLVRDGMEQMKNVIPILPLPAVISGAVNKRNFNQLEGKVVPFYNVSVELSGVISPATAKLNKKDNNLIATTDGEGRFFFKMPERYSLEEILTFTVKQGANSQTFTFNSRDIIENVPEQKLLNLILEYDDFYAEYKNKVTERELIAEFETKKEIFDQNILEATKNLEILEQSRTERLLKQISRYEFDAEKLKKEIAVLVEHNEILIQPQIKKLNAKIALKNNDLVKEELTLSNILSDVAKHELEITSIESDYNKKMFEFLDASTDYYYDIGMYMVNVGKDEKYNAASKAVLALFIGLGMLAITEKIKKLKETTLNSIQDINAKKDLLLIKNTDLRHEMFQYRADLYDKILLTYGARLDKIIEIEKEIEDINANTTEISKLISDIDKNGETSEKTAELNKLNANLEKKLNKTPTLINTKDIKIKAQISDTILRAGESRIPKELIDKVKNNNTDIPSKEEIEKELEQSTKYLGESLKTVEGFEKKLAETFTKLDKLITDTEQETWKTRNNIQIIKLEIIELGENIVDIKRYFEGDDEYSINLRDIRIKEGRIDYILEKIKDMQKESYSTENYFDPDSDFDILIRETEKLKEEIKEFGSGIEKISIEIARATARLEFDNFDFEKSQKIMADYRAKIQVLDSQTSNIDVSYSDNDPEIWLSNLNGVITLESRFEEPFTVIDEVFKGEELNTRKALPSVKLMGEGDKAIHLESDDMPSRTFTYSMLQRIVEPMITPHKHNGKLYNNRVAISAPIDVASFKTNFYQKPNEIAKMSSLGMGYVLNMNQAWVPDGFSLGTLLYSTILAPGEEQRLVVREKNQAYTIQDTSNASDIVSDSYVTLQEDDITATMSEATNSISAANVDFITKTSTGGFSFGLLAFGAGSSSSTTKGLSNASQRNSQNYSNSAANSFNSAIQTAAQRISQAKRLAISAATSTETDSVATKIIANHNHSHTLTIQYWEVMRRYSLKTSIDGVNLALFVPLNPVNFLNNSDYYSEEKVLNSSKNLKEYYKVPLDNYDILQKTLPRKYVRGLQKMKHFTTFSNWKVEKEYSNSEMFSFSFVCKLHDFEKLSAIVVLKNGSRIQCRGNLDTNKIEAARYFPNTYYKSELLELLLSRVHLHEKTQNFSFNLPSNTIAEDIVRIELRKSCSSAGFRLSQNYLNDPYYMTTNKVVEESLNNAIKDNVKTDIDAQKIVTFESTLPEAYHTPIVYFTAEELMDSEIEISNVQMHGDSGISNLMYKPFITKYLSITPSFETAVLKLNDARLMRETFEHILENTMLYSKYIWESLSTDERIMLLDKFTIQMTDDKYGMDSLIPLLNCVDIHKPIGFYGNCMLLPFTCPQEISALIGKTSAEIQDELYRYHTNAFRSPVTTVTLPTGGMVAEAVLSETNVSEKIDITRFWNWQDSPIEKMNIDADYLNSTDYLLGKNTKDITALNLAGAEATTARDTINLAESLIGREAAEFKDLTSQLSSLLSNATNANVQAQQTMIQSNKELATKAMEYSMELLNDQLGKDAKTGKDEAGKTSNNASGGKNSTSASGTGSSTSSGGGTSSTSGANVAANGLGVPQFAVPAQVYIPLQTNLAPEKKVEKTDKDTKTTEDDKSKEDEAKGEVQKDNKPQEGQGNNTPDNKPKETSKDTTANTSDKQSNSNS